MEHAFLDFDLSSLMLQLLLRDFMLVPSNPCQLLLQTLSGQVIDASILFEAAE